MDNIHLFLSRSALASIGKSDVLRAAVEHLAEVITEISSSKEERDEWVSEADCLLKDILDDGGAR